MNPWMILGMLAGVYGISRIAQASTVAAQTTAQGGVAAEGRVMSADSNGVTLRYAVPTGKTQSIKGRDNKQHTVAVYSPTKKFTVTWADVNTAVAAAQKNVVVYNGTGANGMGTGSTGPNRSMTLFTDGTQKVAIPTDTLSAAQVKAGGGTLPGSGSGSSSSNTTVQKALNDAKALIQSASQASDAGQWAQQNAGQIASTIAEIVAAIASASSADQATLNQMKSQLEAFGIQTGVQVATSVAKDIASSLNS